MSGNAIETLRQVVEEHGFQATNPMLSTLAADALADLEALLEAAKADLDYLSESVVGTSFVIPETTHALAAAVRRVETGQ